MDPKFERIQNLFLQVLELGPNQRARFLESACAGDAEMRREVESLLAYDGASEKPIADALGDVAQSLFDSDEVIGTRLGVWRVQHEIGRGGMGTVYLACRDDDQFHKRVAIQVVKRGMDTTELLNRFRRERQILANLDHPYIARLIDGGNTPRGQPFLVMEYVEGKPIDAYCREAGLDVEARCRLFLKVCEAVSCAHRNLVIHRDLKPGNILVANDGSPKLLDFGVAKLLDAELDPENPATLAAGRLLTPEYASPEQVRGELVGTGSDVYALGAILYELLTEVKAQSVDSHSPAELERAICQTEVAAPSTRVDPANARLRRRLSGDLDNVVLMAMSKEPGRRYHSVDLFAEDLTRHLEGRTVMARRSSVGYRLASFARRHRYGLTAAGLVVISMVGGTWAALVEAHRARIEQKRAEARLSQMVELANRALFDVHSSIERLPGAMDARRQLVKTTVDYLKKLSTDAGSDEGLRKALGAAYFRLGDLQGYPFTPNLGDTSGAIESLRSSAALLDPLRRAHPDNAEAQRLWLETEDHLATLLTRTGAASGAAKLLHEALPAAQALAKVPGASLDAERIQAEFYDHLAETIEDPSQALPYARQSLAIFSDLAARSPDRPDLLSDQSDIYGLVGRILHQQGDLHGTREQYLRCVAIREQLVKAHPDDVVYKRNLMIGYGHIGDTLGSPITSNLGDSTGALAYYRRAVAIGKEIYNSDPHDSTAKFDLAVGRGRVGMVEVPMASLAESLASLRTSASMLQGLLLEDPKALPPKRMLALTLEYEGRRLEALGRYREAITKYRQSVGMSDTMLAADRSDRVALSQAVASNRGMATAMAMTGDRAGALRQARATIARAEAGVNAGPDQHARQRYVIESTLELGSIYEILAKRSPSLSSRQDWEAARSTLQHSLAMMDSFTRGKPAAIDVSDQQNAKKMLAEAETHLSPSQPSAP